MLNPMNLKCGMTVVCQDDENVESLVKRDHLYVVREISHRGALIKLRGVDVSLASCRFTPVQSSPPPMELADASIR